MTSTLSPAEVFMDVVARVTQRDIVPHVIVGPADHHQQQGGVASIMDAGKEGIEPYLPLVKPRFQIRCIAPTLSRCEFIGTHVAYALGDVSTRLVARQVDGVQYLVHSVTVTSGPSAHRDTDGTWEYLLFATALIGTTPIPTS